MSESDDAGEEIERDIPNRVLGLHATIEQAVAKAEETSSYRRKFKSASVQRGQYRDLPDRTLRRAMKDAEALGWIEKQRQQWLPGPTAEQYAPEPAPTPNGWVARANADDAWHLQTGGSEAMCGAELDLYMNDDAEQERIGHMADEDSDVLAVDICNDCLGI